MPAGEIRAGNVTHLSTFNQVVESAQDFIGWSESVESVEMVDVNVVGTQAAQAGFAGLQQVMPRGSQIVGPFAHPEGGLGGNQYILTAPLNGLAQNLLGQSFRVNVGGVKKIDAGLQADGDEAASLGYVGCSPGAKKLGAPAKCSSAKAEYRYFQSRTAKLSEFHFQVDAMRQ